MVKLAKEMEELRIKALKAISENPRCEENKAILEKTEFILSTLKEYTEKKHVEAHASIEVVIGEYRFTKYEHFEKGISVYKIDKDGLYEFVDNIKICDTLKYALNDIDSIKIFTTEWYNDYIINGQRR